MLLFEFSTLALKWSKVGFAMLEIKRRYYSYATLVNIKIFCQFKEIFFKSNYFITVAFIFILHFT